MPKVKEFCKWQERSKICSGETSLRVSADFSAESSQTIIEWFDILKGLKGKQLQLRIIYQGRLSFIFEGEIVSQTDIKGVYQNQTGLTRKKLEEKKWP